MEELSRLLDSLHSTEIFFGIKVTDLSRSLLCFDSSAYQQSPPPPLLGNISVSYIKNQGISGLLLICWLGDTQIWTGEKRICSPPPYRSAMSPKKQLYDIPPFFIRSNPTLQLTGLYSIAKYTIPKNFSYPFYWKGKFLLHKKFRNEFEPLTIDLWLEWEVINHFSIWI